MGHCFMCANIDIVFCVLGADAEVVQISAVYGDNNFNQYIIPECAVDQSATDVTGISKVNGVLYHHDQPLEAVSADERLLHFITWLSKFTKPVLIGHNVRNCDCPTLLNSIIKCDMINEMAEVILGFVDSLGLFEKKFSGRSTYKQKAWC